MWKPNLARAGIALAMLAALVPATATSAAAQSGTPFVCDGTPYIMQNSELFRIDPDPADPNQFVFNSVNDTTRFGNSLAYDAATNLIYGIRSQKVETYDADGNVVRSMPLLSPWPGGSSYAATTLGDGRYVVVQYNRDYNGSNDNLWSVDPVTGNTSWIGPLATRHADLAFNPADGYMYHVTGGKLYKIDPRDGSQITLPLASGLGSHGSSWFDAAGNLFVHHNATGNLYQVSEIGSDEAQWRLAGTGDPVSGGDGANCIGGLDLEQTTYGTDGEVLTNESTVKPGDTLTQIFTVYNNELPADTSTLTVCDQISGDGATYTGSFVTSNGTGSLVSGGESGSSSFCYAVDAPSNLWGDPDTPAEDAVELTVELQISQTAPDGDSTSQGWIELDGNPETKDVPADNTGTGTVNDGTAVTVASVEPEPTPEPAPEPAPEEEAPTESYEVSDAGLGQGAACQLYADESMLPRVSVDDVVIVSEPTSLFSSGFDNLNGISILSGAWSVDGGTLNQLNTCGSDYTALLNTSPVEHFTLTANYSSIDTGNNAGLTFGVSSLDTRSGAMLVDLAENGQIVRWGYYDAEGYYQYVGSASITPVATGEAVSLSVEVHGATATISLNGQEISTIETQNARGYVGLVSSLSTVAYDDVQLIALPAA